MPNEYAIRREGSGETDSRGSRDSHALRLVLRTQPRSGSTESDSCEKGESLFGIDSEVFYGLLHHLRVNRSFLGQRIKRGDNRQVGIDFEEPAEALARIASAKSIGAKGHQPAGNPRSNLIGNCPHEVRNGNEHSLFI